MNICPAMHNDLPRLRHLWAERQTILNQTDPRFPAPDDGLVEGFAAQMMARMGGGGVVLAGVVDDEIAGLISGKIRGDIALVDIIALDAHTYHAGLGRALWHSFGNWSEDAGATQIVVCVPRYHAVEQAFWRALGAVERQSLSLATLPEDKHQWEIPPQLMWMAF